MQRVSSPWPEVRFEKEAIDLWLESFTKSERMTLSFQLPIKEQTNIDMIIEKAKREAYNLKRRETRPKSVQEKEKDDGAV